MSTINPIITRNFILGDEWLYLKIYTGYKSSEMILREAIHPLIVHLLQQQVIDKWFFIRYNDPKYHIRIRFHLTDCVKLGELLLGFNGAIKPYINEDMIWKVQADTYQREIERYGSNTMELAEDLFFADSTAILELIRVFYGNEDENARWLVSMKMIDAFLSDFGYDLPQKMELMQRMQENYHHEFNVETASRQQLSSIYREHKTEIEKVMRGELHTEYVPIIAQKSENIAGVVQQLQALSHKNEMEIPLHELMPSYIHMLMNRLFRTNQRKNELVVYDFVFNYYKSQIARMKYQK